MTGEGSSRGALPLNALDQTHTKTQYNVILLGLCPLINCVLGTRGGDGRFEMTSIETTSLKGFLSQLRPCRVRKLARCRQL